MASATMSRHKFGSPPVTKSLLLDLPLDIRKLIYELYFQGYIVSFCNSISECPIGCLTYQTYAALELPRYWPRSRLDQWSRRKLPAHYKGRPYMTYAGNQFPSLTSGLVLRQQSMWPLLCVCQQVYHEAAPLSLSNLHFSFSSAYLFSNTLLLSHDMFLRKLLAVQEFAPALYPRVADAKMVDAFSRMTSLQVRINYENGKKFDTIQKISGSAIAKYIPKLRHFVLDVSTSYVVSPRYLPRACIVEALWGLGEIKTFSMIDTNHHLNGGHCDTVIVANAYEQVVKRHFEIGPIDNRAPGELGNPGRGLRLARDEHNPSVLRQAIFDAVVAGIDLTPRTTILRYRLSSSRGRYCAAKGYFSDGFD